MKILFPDLSIEIGRDVAKTIERVVKSGWLILGNEVAQFEKEFFTLR